MLNTATQHAVISAISAVNVAQGTEPGPNCQESPCTEPRTPARSPAHPQPAYRAGPACCPLRSLRPSHPGGGTGSAAAGPRGGARSAPSAPGAALPASGRRGVRRMGRGRPGAVSVPRVVSDPRAASHSPGRERPPGTRCHGERPGEPRPGRFGEPDEAAAGMQRDSTAAGTAVPSPRSPLGAARPRHRASRGPCLSRDAALVGRGGAVSLSRQVQRTGGSSVVSKCSAAARGYIQDRFLRLLVGRRRRRAPLIHR